MSDVPLISCIMPTRNRSAFVTQAIHYFLAQRYTNKELIIVDTSDLPSGDLENVHPGIRSIWLSRPHTIGMMRNIACSLATGDFICTWDDDDYYGPERLGRQIDPILSGQAGITAMRMSLLLDADKGEMWQCSEEVHKALFAHNVRAGTLMYQRFHWENWTQYTNASKGEDVIFLSRLLEHGAKLAPVVDPSSYICVRHGGNTTAAIDGLDMPGWTRIPLEDSIPAEHQAFYAGLRKVEAAV